METIIFGIICALLGISVWRFKLSNLLSGFSKYEVEDKETLCRIGGLYTLFPIGVLFIILDSVVNNMFYFLILILIIIIMIGNIMYVNYKLVKDKN